MDKDQLDGLLALKLVATKRSFIAAANELGISPPAVSKIIKQLEDRLGVALLYRTSRSTRLTEAGEQFLGRVGPALDEILISIQSVSDYAQKPAGLLRLNMSLLVYELVMEPIITGFVKKYPEITVELVLADQVVDVVETNFDAAIRLSDVVENDMVAMNLFGPLRWVTAASPKYLAKAGKPKHPKDLLSHNCILLRRINTDVYDRWEFEQKGRAFHVKVKGSFVLSDWGAINRAGAAGCGVIYTIEEAIRPLVQAGKLEVLLSQFAPSSSGFYLYYPKRSQVQPKLRALIDYIRATSKQT